MNTPDYSIIINNYNYGQFLKDSISSALSQTHPSFEVIVVDDGSTDYSRDIIDSFGSQVISLFKSNGGQASAFNVGFKASKGKKIIFLDADDRLHPDLCKKIEPLWLEDIVRIQYDLRIINGSGAPGQFTYWECFHKGNLSSGDIRPFLINSQLIAMPTTGNVFKREVLEAIFPMPEEPWRICADTFLVALTSFYGKILSLAVVLGDYRIHSSNQWVDSGSVSYKKIWKICRYQSAVSQLLISYEQKTALKIHKDAYHHSQLRVLKSKLVYKILEGGDELLPSDRSLSIVKEGIRFAWTPFQYLFVKKMRITVWFLLFPLLTKKRQQRVAKRAFASECVPNLPHSPTTVPFLNLGSVQQ